MNEEIIMELDMGRDNIFERIFEELVDNDLIDLHNYEYENAKKVVMEIMENRFKDFLIIQGKML